MNKENEIVEYTTKRVEIQPHRNNYAMKIGDFQDILKRGVDFGMITRKDKESGRDIPISEKPTLFKSGAEKILLGMGVPYDIIMKDSYKDFSTGLFYYEILAVAKDNNGNTVRVGVGCANTNEKSNGFAKGWDTANSVLKKAKKRAIVDLAISLASASDWFTQDMEDTKNEERASQLQSENDKINSKQIRRIFAIASNKGLTVERAKDLLAEWGYTSTKDITVADYDNVCEKLENYAG